MTGTCLSYLLLGTDKTTTIQLLLENAISQIHRMWLLFSFSWGQPRTKELQQSTQTITNILWTGGEWEINMKRNPECVRDLCSLDSLTEPMLYLEHSAYVELIKCLSRCRDKFYLDSLL